MKNKRNILTYALVAIFILLAGFYALNSYIYNQKQAKTYLFEEELFTLEFPGAYTTDGDGVIYADGDVDFGQFLYNINDLEEENIDFIAQAEEVLKILCNQTKVCGKMINNANFTVNDINGVKFTIQYPGRALGEKEGYINQYHYNFVREGKAYDFHTSVSDNNEPEKRQNIFESIMESIKFK